jgi:HEAT repeat protein
VLGVYLLSAHRDEAALSQLAELATDSEPAVAGAALRRLFEVDPKLVFPLAVQALQSSDVNVRRVGAKALVVRSDVAAIDSLAPLLKDPNPSLRR